MRIRITQNVPIVEELKPEVGTEHEVTKLGKEESTQRTIYFIQMKNKDVGLYSKEFEIVEL